MDTTTIIAIYGALISSVLLFLRFRDRSDKKRKLLVRIDRFVDLNSDTYNYHNGRKGNQFIRIRITNQSSNPNAIESVEIKSESSFLGFRFNKNNIPLNFNHDFNLPLGLIYSAIATGYIFIHMNPREFHKSWKNNYDVFKELTQKYIVIKVTDTQGKEYISNRIEIKIMLKDFLEKEMELTTNEYYKEEYNKISS